MCSSLEYHSFLPGATGFLTAVCPPIVDKVEFMKKTSKKAKKGVDKGGAGW